MDIDFGNLKRDAGVVMGSITQAPTGEFINTGKEDIRIVFPVRYKNIGLYDSSEAYNSVYNAFMITKGTETYALWLSASMIRIGLAPMFTFSHNGMDYMGYIYKPGEVILTSKDVIQDATLAFNIVNETTILGKIPFYMDYDDLGRLVDWMGVYGGSNIGDMNKVIELIVSRLAHDPTDTSKHYRHNPTGKRPVFYGMSNVQAQSLSTFSKVMGNYAGPALLSSVISDNDLPASKLENLLRHN